VAAGLVPIQASGAARSLACATAGSAPGLPPLAGNIQTTACDGHAGSPEVRQLGAQVGRALAELAPPASSAQAP